MWRRVHMRVLERRKVSEMTNVKCASEWNSSEKNRLNRLHGLCSHSTYEISCRGIAKEELDTYDAENILERMLDENLDEATHLPIERCHGVAITGKFDSILVMVFFFFEEKKFLNKNSSLEIDTNELIKRKKVKCSYEGVIYQKGERIRPDGTCIECICDEKLKNTNDLDINTAQCQRKQCAIGTSGEEHDYLNRGCVPVYDKTSTICCPIEWKCRKYFHVAMILVIWNIISEPNINEIKKI